MNSIESTDTVELGCALNAVLRNSVAKAWAVLPRNLAVPKLFLQENVPAFYIFNVEPNGYPGKHWVAVAITKTDSIFFDPIGNPPSKYDFPFVTKQVNTVRIQGPTSKLCGLFCLVFVKYMLENFDLNKFLSLFSSNYILNDALVYQEYLNFKKCGVPALCYHGCFRE